MIHFNKFIQERVLGFQSIAMQYLTFVAASYVFNYTQAVQFRLAEDGGTKFIEALSSTGSAFDDTKGKMQGLMSVKYEI